MASYFYKVSLLSAEQTVLNLRLEIIHDDVDDFPEEQNFALQLLWETLRVTKTPNSYLNTALSEEQVGNEWWMVAHAPEFIKSVAINRTDASSPEAKPVAEYKIEVTDPRLLEHIQGPSEWSTASYAMTNSLAKFMKAKKKSSDPVFYIEVKQRSANSVMLRIAMADLDLESFPQEKSFGLRVIWEASWRMEISDCFIATAISPAQIADNKKCQQLADKIIGSTTIIRTENFPMSKSLDDMSDDEYDTFRSSEKLWPAAEYSLEVTEEKYIEHLLPGQVWYSSVSESRFDPEE
jgi:hypothetical protein